MGCDAIATWVVGVVTGVAEVVTGVLLGILGLNGWYGYLLG